MDRNNYFIPDKLNVGFQKRGDTYTGMLAYVIYFYKQGKLRKEKSWQSWRDDKIKIDKKKQKLADLEARLDKVISPELKAQMELDDISKALS